MTAATRYSGRELLFSFNYYNLTLFCPWTAEWAAIISNLELLHFNLYVKNSHAFIWKIGDWRLAPPFPEAFAAARRR